MKTTAFRFFLPKPTRSAAPIGNFHRMAPAARNRTWQRLLVVACCGVLPSTSVRADTAYTEDFATGVSGNWSGTNLPASQATGTNTSWFLGELNNDTVSLALTGLDLGGGNATANSQGSHAFVTVSYDLFVIGGWTGNNDSNAATAHTFAFQTSSTATAVSPRLTTTFSNLPGQFQAFVQRQLKLAVDDN